jgi:hypothetical protein
MSYHKLKISLTFFKFLLNLGQFALVFPSEGSSPKNLNAELLAYFDIYILKVKQSHDNEPYDVAQII